MAHIHIPDDIPVRYLERSKQGNLIALALIAVGALSFGAALVTAPWQTLLAVCALYLLMLPFGWRAVAAALFFSIYLPFVFFGAWMRVHFRAAGTA